MSTIDNKKKIFGNIAALKTVSGGLPQLTTSSSFPSINNGGDSITFLCDLLKSLIGYDELKKTITNTLAYNSKNIELEIKNLLKTELKSIVSCGVNPSLPEFIRSDGNGINIKVNRVDFTNLMLIDPKSEIGNTLYNDFNVQNLINSTDFNTFLYQTIQNNGTEENWKNILNFKFDSVDVNGLNPNNSLTIKANELYDSKTLTELNNNYIDSISLFNVENIFTNLVDTIFGSISNVARKSLKQLEMDAKINTVINKITNSEIDDQITDSYFNFSNNENNFIEFNAKLRQKGQKIINTNGQILANVPFGIVQNSNLRIKSAQTVIEQKNAISKSIEDIGNQLTLFNTDPVDDESVKLNFIQDLIDNLIKILVNSILSPKVIMIFIINFKIIYGEKEDFSDPIDFFKKNKVLVKNIIKRIKPIIIRILLKIAVKEIIKLIAKGKIKKNIEKNKAKLVQLLSLIGIDQNIIRQIKGLT
jgi:hypothetical protein